jgi:hypothetical protein
VINRSKPQVLNGTKVEEIIPNGSSKQIPSEPTNAPPSSPNTQSSQLLPGLQPATFVQIPQLSSIYTNGDSSRTPTDLNSPKIEEEEEEEDVIAHKDEIITLKDPVTLCKISHAAKGVNCVHKQCFDLEVCFYNSLIIIDILAVLSSIQVLELSRM